MRLMTKDQIEQAKRLALLYTELAEKGTWFEYTGLSKSGPAKLDLETNLNHWRVANKPLKIIDLSQLVNTDIDMEFDRDYKHFSNSYISTLTDINNIKQGYYKDKHGNIAYYCRVRETHWHHWHGYKECPLPKGLIVKLMFRNGQITSTNDYIATRYSNNWKHQIISEWDIIAFRVSGPAEGYQYK